MEMELQFLDLRYERLRSRHAGREARLLASLADNGQQAPVVVVEAGGKLVLLDGYKRVRALRRLARDTVIATRWEVGEVEALILERLMRSGVAASAIEQAWLLRELRERFGLEPPELARRFDRSPSWVSRRLALCGQLPEWVQERVRLGQLAPHAAMKCLVPMARANREACERLVEEVASHKLSTRQIATLYDAWRTGGEREREALLENPLLFLRAHDEARRADPPALAPAERLVADLDALAGIARRADRLLRDGVAASFSDPERQRTVRCYAQARSDTDRLWSRCHEELDRARPDDASRHPQAS